MQLPKIFKTKQQTPQSVEKILKRLTVQPSEIETIGNVTRIKVNEAIGGTEGLGLMFGALHSDNLELISTKSTTEITVRTGKE